MCAQLWWKNLVVVVDLVEFLFSHPFVYPQETSTSQYRSISSPRFDWGCYFFLSLSLSLYALIECDANLVLQRMRTLAEWTQEGKKSLILIWACPLSTTKVSFRFRWHSHRDWNREIARYDCSEPVWPDLTKFCHFGNTYYNLGQMVMVYLIFGKFLNLL